MACPGQNQPADYSEENIQTFRGAEHIRFRPGMYIGNTDAAGLSHLLFELVTESLAEAVAGRGQSVRVTLHADGSAEVADDGRPMPNVEAVFTEFNAGQRGDVNPYRSRCGLHDVTYVVANALAERLTVFVRGDNSIYQHSFQRGITHAVLQSSGPPDDRGLTVRFLPDPQIFGDARFDADAIRNRLQQLAFLHSGVRITFTDETTGTHDEFEYADGIRDYVEFLNEDRQPLHADVIVLRGEEEGVRHEVGLQWCAGESETRMSFANHYFTQLGGTHDHGLTSGVAAALCDLIRERMPAPGEFTGDDFRTGLVAVVSVWLADPRFESATHARLGSPEVESIVKDAVQRGVREYFEANADAATRVVNAVIAARDARIAAATAIRNLRKAKRGE